MSTPETILKAVETTIISVEKQSQELDSAIQDLKQLREQLQLARGTQDVTSEAAEIKRGPGRPRKYPSLPDADLRTNIKLALTRESLSLQQIAKMMHESVGRVQGFMKSLRAEGLIWNVGSAEHPQWTWKCGDVDTPALTETIRRLLTERPMSTKELTEATGARFTRVEGCVITLRRGAENVVNLGGPRSAKWFIISDRARNAKLQPQQVMKPTDKGSL